VVCVIPFDGEFGYGVVPTHEFYGDPATILLEYDPLWVTTVQARARRALAFLRAPRSIPTAQAVKDHLRMGCLRPS
jgi:hypothetical protein